MGKIRGTLRIRSHVHRATTKYFPNSFLFKNEIEKEGLPRDVTPALGAGGPEFKSRRPDHLLLYFELILSDNPELETELGPKYKPLHALRRATLLLRNRVQVNLARDLRCRAPAEIASSLAPLAMRAAYFRAGDVWSSRLTSGLAEATTVSLPVTISLAPISLPYSFLLASLSVSIDAPSSDTPAKSPLDRE